MDSKKMETPKSCTDRCGGGQSVSIPNVCWTLQYNTFHPKFSDTDARGEEQVLRLVPERDKSTKIDHATKNACIQFYDRAGTPITPPYDAKFYKTAAGEYEVYMDSRYLRPDLTDLQVAPLTLFQSHNPSRSVRTDATEKKKKDVAEKHQKTETLQKKDVLDFSRETHFNTATYHWDLSQTSKDSDFGREYLRSHVDKSWRKNVFLALYDTLFPNDEVEDKAEPGACNNYEEKGGRLVEGSRFVKTYCIFFDLEISHDDTPKKKEPFCIKCSLANDQIGPKEAHCRRMGRSKLPNKHARDMSPKPKRPRRREEPAEEMQPPMKSAPARSFKPLRSRTKSGQENTEASLINNLCEAYRQIETQDVDGSNAPKLKTLCETKTLTWEYQPRKEYTLEFQPTGKEETLWMAIKGFLNNLENKQYGRDELNILSGKEAYELDDNQVTYKYALDALWNYWLYVQTKNQSHSGEPTSRPPAPPPSQSPSH